MLGLSRPELLEVRPPATGTEVIELEPLTARRDAASSSDDLGVDEPGLRRPIVEVADGNPLFVEQLAAMVREAPSSADGDPRFPPRSRPSSTRASTGCRATSARRSSVRPWSAGSSGRAPSWISARPASAKGSERPYWRSSARDLVEPAPSSALPFDDVFRFRHALIRDAAYGGLPKTERAELHERFAVRLDSAPVGAADAPDEIVGYHLELAWRYRTELGIVDAGTAMLGETAGRRLGAAARGAFSREDLLGASFLLAARDPAAAGR